MSVSKKARFEVFKRDNFTCQYCGKTPPSAILEVDHIRPRSKRGKDNIENLITSCFDCNRGKAGNPLSCIPKSIKDTSTELAEREDQLKEYRKLLSRIERRKNADVAKIEYVFREYFEKYYLKSIFKENIKLKFIDKLPINILEDSMRLACSRINESEKAIKYFCGIAWNKILGDDRNTRRWRHKHG